LSCGIGDAMGHSGLDKTGDREGCGWVGCLVWVRHGEAVCEARWLATPGGEYNCVVRRSSTMNEQRRRRRRRHVASSTHHVLSRCSTRIRATVPPRRTHPLLLDFVTLPTDRPADQLVRRVLSTRQNRTSCSRDKNCAYMR